LALHTVKEHTVGASVSVMTGWKPVRNIAGGAPISITGIVNASVTMIIVPCTAM